MKPSGRKCLRRRSATDPHAQVRKIHRKQKSKRCALGDLVPCDSRRAIIPPRSRRSVVYS
eukprot:1417537-Alexandrium_andersonii.AAC.1